MSASTSSELPQSHDSVQRVVRNSTANLIAQAVNALCNVAIVFVLARRLGKATLGEYFLIFAILQAIQMILESGITTVLTCRIVQSPSNWKRTVSEANAILVLVVIASVGSLAGIGMAWSAWRGDTSMILPFAIAGVACAAIQVNRFGSAVFRAFEQFRFENFSRVIQGVLFVGIVIAVAYSGPHAVSLVLAAFAISHVVASAYLLIRLEQRWNCLGWRFSGAVLRDWWSESVPLGLGDVVRRLTWQLDTILLGAMKPPAVVGLYSVAYRPLGPLNWVPRAILNAAFPSLARAATEDRDQLERTFVNSIRLLWITSLPIAVTICICAEPLVLLLAGTDFREAALPMQVLIWISTLSFLSIQFRFLFTALGKQRMFANLVIAIFLLEAALEVALIPVWGYMGACTGSLIGEFVFTAAGIQLCHRLGVRGFQWSEMLRAVVAGAIMAAIIWPGTQLPLPWLVLLVLFATLNYFVACVLLGALKRDEASKFFAALSPRARRQRRQLRAARKATLGAVILLLGGSLAVGEDAFAPILAKYPRLTAQPFGKGVFAHVRRSGNTRPARSQAIEAWSKHPNIAGTQLSYSWTELEPEHGRLRWELIEADLEPWAREGKKCWIEISTANKRDDTGARGTPGWVFDAGVPRVQAEGTGLYPVFWHSKYLELWGGFITALAEKFDGDPRIEFFSTGGYANGHEPGLSSWDNDSLLKQWRAAGFDGFTVEGVYLNQAIKPILNRFDDAFSRTPVAQTIHVKTAFDQAMNAYAVQLKFIMLSNGLGFAKFDSAARHEWRNRSEVWGVKTGFSEWGPLGRSALKQRRTKDPRQKVPLMIAYRAAIGDEGALAPRSRISYLPLGERIPEVESEDEWNAALQFAAQQLEPRLP